MKPAREVAHAIVCERQDSEWCHWTTDRTVHAHYCDSLTAAIEARDAEHAAEREALIKRATELGDTVTATAEANMDALAIVASAREADRAAYALDASRLREQVRVAREALQGIDFGRVRADGYCDACEECDAENPCIHRLAHDTLTTLDTLATSGGGG